MKTLRDIKCFLFGCKTCAECGEKVHRHRSKEPHACPACVGDRPPSGIMRP